MQKARVAAPLGVILLILSFLCPQELSLYVAGLRLPPHRVALIALLPVAFMRLMSGREIKPQSFDILFMLFAIWTTWVYAYHAGHEGFVYGGSMALESLGGYLIARAFIRNEAEFRGSLRFLLFAIAAAALLAIMDTVSGNYFVHSILRQFVGGDPLPPMQYRMGLARAASVFDHPIHYGTFCAALLAVFWFTEKQTASRVTQSAVASVATLLGMSSAPLLCIGLQGSMIAWERATRGISLRTPITLALIAGLFIGVALISSRGPVQIIATTFTLDSWTGYYRTQIWEFGLQNVWAHPWAGIGLGEWDRPKWMVSSTVDAFWLVTAMRSGIPGFLLIAVPTVLIGRAVVKRAIHGRDANRRRMAQGWMISLVALCLIATTVHYWNVVQAFFFFFIGLGGWLADPVRERARVAAGATRPSRPRHPSFLRPASPRPAPQPDLGFPGIPVPAFQ